MSQSIPAVTRERDDALESLIESAYLRLVTAETPEERKAIFDELVSLVNSRSPERIAEMERNRGLR